MVVLAILFVIAAIATFAVVTLSSTDAHVMPWSCPACHHGSSSSQAWFVAGNRIVQCRECRKQFREAANGTLVEVR